MQLIVESEKNHHKVLIVYKTSSPLVALLKKELLKYEYSVFLSPKVPPHLAPFTLCFFIGESPRTIKKYLHHIEKQKHIFILENNAKQLEHLREYAGTLPKKIKSQNRIINIESSTDLESSDIEKILWFSLSPTEEITFTLYKDIIRKKNIPTIQPIKKPPISVYHIRKQFTPKRVIVLIIGIIILIHVLFIPPLIISSYYLVKAGQSLQNKDFDKTRSQENIAKVFLEISKKLYSLSRPTYMFFSIASTVDTYTQVNDTGINIIDETIPFYDQSKEFISLVLKRNKTPDEQKKVEAYPQKAQESIDNLQQYVSILSGSLPSWHMLDNTRKQLQDTNTLLDTFSKLLPNLDSLLAKGTEKKYLILFANNMELRPGGGFIGSFAVLTLKDYTYMDMTVYDVYDADGQLKVHVEPPAPIRNFLEQPHWFLRDSAFSPDFPENFQQAKSFLKLEMNMDNFDGGALVTTTTIQNILEALGDLYIPEFKEMVNKGNFYLKAQLYSEKDFFPGSTQKKRFLGAVADQLMIHLEDASIPTLLKMVKKSLDEKQMVLYFDDSSLEDLVTNNYWSGKVIEPRCSPTFPNCISDFIFPIEANLGVNKANFFIHKNLSLHVDIDSSGTITNTFTMSFKNDSFSTVFPGGTYKNYLQIMLPPDAQLGDITKNGSLVENAQVKDDATKTVGFYIEIPPQKTENIVLKYSLDSNLHQGKNNYQLILQKQIGSPNSPFDFTLSLPSNASVSNSNFSPLVKNNEILYNTTVTGDKIFLLEILKN